MAFQPGQSGNPGGRPKSIANALKAKYGQDGEKLLEAFDGLAFDAEDDTVRLQALKWLGDQFWGKAKETRELTGQILPMFALPAGARVNVTEDDPQDGVPDKLDGVKT